MYLDRIKELEAKIDRSFEFTDPRPRDREGQFADVSVAGSDPDTMRKAYGSPSQISSESFKKLRRRLPRALARMRR